MFLTTYSPVYNITNNTHQQQQELHTVTCWKGQTWKNGRRYSLAEVRCGACSQQWSFSDERTENWLNVLFLTVFFVWRHNVRTFTLLLFFLIATCYGEIKMNIIGPCICWWSNWHQHGTIEALVARQRYHYHCYHCGQTVLHSARQETTPSHHHIIIIIIVCVVTAVNDTEHSAVLSSIHRTRHVRATKILHRYTVRKIYNSTVGKQADQQTDGQTDRRTDGRTDRQCDL